MLKIRLTNHTAQSLYLTLCQAGRAMLQPLRARLQDSGLGILKDSGGSCCWALTPKPSSLLMVPQTTQLCTTAIASAFALIAGHRQLRSTVQSVQLSITVAVGSSRTRRLNQSYPALLVIPLCSFLVWHVLYLWQLWASDISFKDIKLYEGQ